MLSYGYAAYIRKGDLPTNAKYDYVVPVENDSLRNLLVSSCSSGYWYIWFEKSNSNPYFMFNTTSVTSTGGNKKMCRTTFNLVYSQLSIYSPWTNSF